ncbi:MAG: Flp pilus assembly complex ATPase component TadA [Actinomycetota bacterium]|nr:Flp pilus assembly complex ATPase component TadA [Actinomycetota bacterium]
MTDNVSPLRPVEEGALGGSPQGPGGVTHPSLRGGSGRFLTDVLVERGFVDRDRVQKAIEEARQTGVSPERVLLDSRAITSEQLSRAIAERYGLDHLDLGVFKVDMAAANLLSASAAKRYSAVPVAYVDDHTLLLAMSDPANVLAVDDIALLTRLDIRPAVASADDIVSLISRMNRFEAAVQAAVEESEDAAAPLEIVDLRESAEDAPVIKLVHSIIAQATERGASDIHFEPQPDSTGRSGRELRVRMRIDGVLTDEMIVPKRMVAGVVSRIKIMSDLDIAERRLPQDGRVGLTIEGRQVDVRVVTIPSVHGESVVLRILDKESIRLELDRLGMAAQELDRFRRAFHRSHGAVLTTGPTGSGKSTSLYGALLELNTPEKNIITIEDPVEYQIRGITQMQVNNKAGLTFATGLRSMMRADPDILMVGEIRDRETAQIAIEGALTGHMVLSTLHTNDAPSAISRLIEMGIEPFLVASAIDCVVAQRLARTLCSHCKQRTIIPAAILRDHGFAAQFDIEAYEAVGCVRCGHMGYRGRVGLYEVMTMSEEIRSLALKRASADQIAAAALGEGMRRLREDGLDKVKSGLTSMSEIARVTGSG